MTDVPYWITKQRERYPKARVLVFDDDQISDAINVLEKVAERISQEEQQARDGRARLFREMTEEYRIVCRFLGRLRDQAMEQEAVQP